MDCSICMESIENRNINCVVTKCGHCFHTNCLMNSVSYNGFNCPYCRTTMADEPAPNDDDSFSNYSDDDLTYDDDDDDDDDYYHDAHVDYMLDGFRYLFQNLDDGQDVTDESAITTDDQTVMSDERSYMYDDITDYGDEEKKTLPTIREISEELRRNKITYEFLVRMVCATHPCVLEHFRTNQYFRDLRCIRHTINHLVEKMEEMCTSNELVGRELFEPVV
ncbi:MAG: RING finger protein [Flavobacterium sp.]